MFAGELERFFNRKIYCFENRNSGKPLYTTTTITDWKNNIHVLNVSEESRHETSIEFTVNINSLKVERDEAKM